MRCDVMFRSVSAVVLPPGQVLQLNAGPGTTVPIESISYQSEFGPVGSGELICHIRGEAESLDAAIRELGNAGVRNLQLFAVAANAAILRPHLTVAYEPNPGGQYKAWQSLGADPQAARRVLDPEKAGRFIEALDAHPESTRLLRASENYGETLRLIYPESSLQAANHAWIAVECLTPVVERRLQREHGTDDLAVILAVKPRRPRESPDRNEIIGALRRRELFSDDEESYKNLRKASDGIEHGFLSFGDARALIGSVFPDAAAHVRQCILSESGLSASVVDDLTTGEYEEPLPLWRPFVVADGAFAAETQFDFEMRPVHLRVHGELEVAKILTEQHATETALKANVNGYDGVVVQLSELGLTAPGTIEIATTRREPGAA